MSLPQVPELHLKSQRYAEHPPLSPGTEALAFPTANAPTTATANPALSEPPARYVLPGFLCCVASVVLLVLSATSHRFDFYLSTSGAAIGFVSEVRLTIEFKPTNISSLPLTLDLSGREWTADSSPVGQLGRAFAAQVGLAMAAIVTLLPLGAFEGLRLTNWLSLVHQQRLVYRLLSTVLALLAVVLCLCRLLLSASLHGRAMSDFVRFLQSRIETEVAVVRVWFPVLADAGVLIAQLTLLALAIRTAIGKPLESIFGTCCGCALAPEGATLAPAPQPSPQPRTPQPRGIETVPPALECVFVTPRAAGDMDPTVA